MRQWLAAVLLMLLTGTSPAQSPCGQCFQSLGDVERRQRELLLEYPGTAIGLLACIEGCRGQPRNEQAQCFLAACGVICLFVGVDNCVNFFSRAYTLEQEKGRICTYCRVNGCRVSECN